MKSEETVTRKHQGWLAQLDPLGPIFGKELRTAARQRRNYVLRFLYLLILTVVVMLIWYATVRFQFYNRIYNTAMMSRASMELLVTIGVFQFIALQIISPVLTSTAISDEISHGTLVTLMMTPISSLQIVTGKLFSKLLTMVLLVATSLPLLAILRIFGGIEWKLVISLVALTLCAAVFAATVSLVFSIFHKKAYTAIVMTYITLATIYLLIPLMIVTLSEQPYRTGPGPDKAFLYFNPFAALILLINDAHAPGMRGPFAGGRGLLWTPVQCFLLLAATFFIVLLSAALVRRVALRLAAGEAVVSVLPEPEPAKKEEKISGAVLNQDGGSAMALTGRDARPVSDHPVLWRELHLPLMGDKRRRAILFGFTAVALGWTYVHVWGHIQWNETHTLYTTMFMLISFVVAAILSAITITSEKESSTLEVLLATPLTAREIVMGKCLGVIKRLLPIGGLYFGHILVFTIGGIIHPLALLHMVLLLPPPIILLVGMGTYFSTRARHTTTAVLLNLGSALALWAILPLTGGLLNEIFRMSHYDSDALLLINPVALNVVGFMDLIAGKAKLTFDIAGARYDAWGFTAILAAVALSYTIVGTAFVGAAIRRFRRPFRI